MTLFGHTRAEYYTCIPRLGNFTRGMTVRDWLTGQAYEDQRAFGLAAMERLRPGLADRVSAPGPELSDGALIYRRALLRWEQDRELAPWHTTLAAWEAQGAALELIREPFGRLEIQALVGEKSPALRLAAAVEVLRWDRHRAREVLESAARQDRGLLGLEAQVVLAQVDAGTLDLDWHPPALAHEIAVPALESELNAVLAVYSTVMSGGFHYAVAAFGPLLAAASRGLAACGLARAASLVAEASGALPWASMPSDEATRSALVRSLPQPISEYLERLAGSFQDEFPRDTVLWTRMYVDTQDGLV
jgi:hypothetical protein